MKLEFTESEMKSYLSSKGYYFTKQGIKALNGSIIKYVEVAYKGNPSPNLKPDEYYSTYGEPTETIVNVFERYKDDMKKQIMYSSINNTLVEAGKNILRNIVLELTEPQKHTFKILFRQEHLKFDLDTIIDNIEPIKINTAISLVEQSVFFNKQNN